MTLINDHRVFLFLSTISVVLVSTSVPYNSRSGRQNPHSQTQTIYVYPPILYSDLSEEDSSPPRISRLVSATSYEDVQVPPSVIRPLYYYVEQGGSVSSRSSLRSRSPVQSDESVDSTESVEFERADLESDGDDSSAESVERDSHSSKQSQVNSTSGKIQLPLDFDSKFAQAWPAAAEESGEASTEYGSDEEEIPAPPGRLYRGSAPSWADGPLVGDPASFEHSEEHFADTDRMRFILPVQYHDTSRITHTKKTRAKKPWDESNLSYGDYVSQMEERARGGSSYDPFDLDSHFSKIRYDEDEDQGEGWGLTDDEILETKGWKKYRKHLGKSTKFAYKALKITRWFQKWMEKKIHKYDVIAPH